MKYSMIQIQPETHQLLKAYCDEHGYKISAIVDKIIKKHISEETVKEDHTKSKAYLEAKAQNASKNKLSVDMHRCFVDLLDSEWIQKELTTYELDPKDRTIILKKIKLKDERKKR